MKLANISMKRNREKKLGICESIILLELTSCYSLQFTNNPNELISKHLNYYNYHTN